MRKFFPLTIFLLLFFFFLFGVQSVYAQEVAIKAIVTQLPRLVSGPDEIIADLYVASNDGTAFTVDGIGGIDFRTGPDPGSAAYFTSPSPQRAISVPVPADGSWVYAGTFITQVINNTGICLTGLNGRIFVRPFFTGSGFTVGLAETEDKLETDITNIGAMIGVLTVYKSDGSPAVGARVDFDNWDSDPGSHPYFTDSFGQVLGIHRLNCTNSHRITATLGGESGFLDLPAQTGSTPNTICNGQSEDFTITMSGAPLHLLLQVLLPQVQLVIIIGHIMNVVVLG